MADHGGSSSDSDMGAQPKTQSGRLIRRILVHRKSLKSILEESAHDQSIGGSKLKLFDLLCIGIGSTIGSGVFVLTGKALTVAGPAAVLSWILAGIICLLSSYSYMELSARLPTKGSCYVFSYHGLGEALGVLGAGCLTMEYGISSAGVARSWAAKVYHAIGHWWVLCLNGETAPAPGCNGDDDYYLDPLAALITMLSTVVVVVGLDMGKIVINSFTVAKVLLVCFMIVGGFSCWTGNMFESAETFFPTGPSGVLSSASLLFFGFIGFDEVCCMASKAENPSQTMPRALVGTLLGAAVISGTAQLALSAMAPYEEGMKGTSFEQAFEAHGLAWARWIVGVGELVLLPLVVLLGILPQPEVTAAMSEDGLLPSVFKKQSRWNGMYVRGTIVVGVILTVVATVVPFAVLWDVISIGVLISFNLTNASLVNIRYGNGGSVGNATVNWLVWLILVLCGVSGYLLNLGVVDPFLNGEPVHTASFVSGGLSLLLTFIICTVIQCKCEVKCEKDDPNIFMAPGVPFVQAAAIFFNFFLLFTMPLFNLYYFALFSVALWIVYILYIARKGSSSYNRDEIVSSDDEYEEEDGTME